MAKTYYVYILASGRNGTPYIGMTNDLARRVWERKEGLVPGFTKTCFRDVVEVTPALSGRRSVSR